MTWGISAELSFAIDIDDVAGEGTAEYDIADPPAPASPDVVVDSGSLTVQRRGDDTLRIGTTKRVLFSEEFPGEGLSLVICILGYGEVAEDFVFTCAIRDGVPDPRDPKGGPRRRLGGRRPDRPGGGLRQARRSTSAPTPRARPTTRSCGASTTRTRWRRTCAARSTGCCATGRRPPT